MNEKRYPFRTILPVILIVFGILTTLVVLTGNPPFLRPVLAFIFLLLVPGLAFVRLLPAEDGITLITLSVALSLAIDTLVSTLLLYTGGFSLRTAFLIIAGISLLGTILQIRPLPERNAEEEQV